MISMSNKQTFYDFTSKFDILVKEDKLNINTIEDLMIENIENYKKELNNHVEDLLKNHVNEKELIIKKNKNGKKKGLN